MFALLFTALTAQPADAADTVELHGRCEYPETVRQYRHETVLATCNKLTISREGNSAALDFGHRDMGPTMKFSGSMSGNRMEVRRVTLRGGETRAAEGTCKIFYTDSEVSVVACLAHSGARSWATNFVKSRI